MKPLPRLTELSLVMYDLDGTLVESVPDLAHAVDAMLADLGLPQVGEASTKLWVGNGIPSLIKRALTNDAHGDEPGRVEDELFQQAFERFEFHYDAALGKFSYLYPDVAEALARVEAANIAQAVVTNKSYDFADRLLQLMGIRDYFTVIVGGDSLPKLKPDAMPLLHAMTVCNASAERSIMVGDSKNDIIAAKAAGVRCIALPYGYNHGEPIEASEPQWLIPTLAELI